MTTIDSDEVRSAVPAHACAGCGGGANWDPGRQELVCPFCGAAVALPPAPTGVVEGFPLLSRLADRPDSGRDWQPVTPGGVLPCRVTLDAARAAFSKWLGAHRFFRSERRRPAIETARTLYVLYWAFSAQVHCRYRGEIVRKGRDGETRNVPIDGVVELTFADMLVPASGALPPNVLQSIQPFPLAELSPYDARYLAGATVEVSSVNMWDAWDTASARMQTELNAALRADSKCHPDLLETWPKWSGEQGKHALVPVYVLTYRHRGTLYEGVVNGWTGKVGGTMPRDLLVEILTWAILLGVLAGLIYGVIRLIGALI